MHNIPTDLLRTLVAVVDQRSYTRAATMLGVTQPAVSAQMKRLQNILGSGLFDRSGPGICLTTKGEIIVEHARHLLSINDRILRFAESNAAAHPIRIGISGFGALRLPELIADFSQRWADLRFRVRYASLDQLLEEMRAGDLDIAVGLSRAEPDCDARYRWSEPVAWMRAATTQLRPAAPIPLVSFREDCIYYRTAVHALNSFGRASELVFVSPTMSSLEGAVERGLGIMALARGRSISRKLTAWDDAPLPPLPELCGGIYLRDGGHRKALEDLADMFAARLQPPADTSRSLKSRAAAAVTAPAVRRQAAGKTDRRRRPA